MKRGGEKRRWEEGDKESRVLKMIEGQQRSDKTHQYCEKLQKIITIGEDNNCGKRV